MAVSTPSLMKVPSPDDGCRGLRRDRTAGPGEETVVSTPCRMRIVSRRWWPWTAADRTTGPGERKRNFHSHVDEDDVRR
ncbi:unnamed protein product [Nesidiocoris tenuis]|uniref:Uncharacterized protein n=1 Tax=Nesidiocoris tenuis TaxID=355587 RepID=A0A6H5GM85_9HEMI|nr:unnamed protein product [Nesidiocoris tenuis]